MVVEIPVTFGFAGKRYEGVLVQVTGAGEPGSIYFLSINHYHVGQFFRTVYNSAPTAPVDYKKPPQYVWRFYSKQGAAPEVAAQLQRVVEAWQQANQ